MSKKCAIYAGNTSILTPGRLWNSPLLTLKPGEPVQCFMADISTTCESSSYTSPVHASSTARVKKTPKIKHSLSSSGAFLGISTFGLPLAAIVSRIFSRHGPTRLLASIILPLPTWRFDPCGAGVPSTNQYILFLSINQIRHQSRAPQQQYSHENTKLIHAFAHRLCFLP